MQILSQILHAYFYTCTCAGSYGLDPTCPSKSHVRAGKTAQWLRALAAFAKDPRSNPSTHVLVH